MQSFNQIFIYKLDTSNRVGTDLPWSLAIFCPFPWKMGITLLKNTPWRKINRINQKQVFCNNLGTIWRPTLQFSWGVVIDYEITFIGFPAPRGIWVTFHVKFCVVYSLSKAQSICKIITADDLVWNTWPFEKVVKKHVFFDKLFWFILQERDIPAQYPWSWHKTTSILRKSTGTNHFILFY